MNTICCIYKITSPSGKIYIGQTTDYDCRIKFYMNLNCKDQTRLYNSLKYYGYNKHNIEIIEECDEINLNIRERHYQEFYNVIGKKGLNCKLTKTDDRSGKLSEETKLKISLANKGSKNSMFGKTHSEEAREKIRQSQLGRKHTVEHRNKVSNKMKGNNYSKLSKLVLNTETGIFYDSINQASNSCNIFYVTLKACLAGKFKNNTSFILV